MDRAGYHLDFACFHIRVDGFRSPRDYVSGNRNYGLVPGFFRDPKVRIIRIDYNLNQAVMVPKIDKNNPAMVTFPVDPSG